jgi:hypothetical protein
MLGPFHTARLQNVVSLKHPKCTMFFCDAKNKNLELLMNVLYVSDATRSSLPMRILCAISRHAFTTITRDRLAFLPSRDRCKFDVVLIDSKGVAREDLSRAKADLFPYISSATPILEIGRGAI